ncbi:histidine phosphatase family protein [Thauera sp.]|uniref:SixA phosphatase family protein n=1 Tax=Thauera sp. TaxID=1905334 RepID=UPI00261C7BF3|nr:histidine phosphatase family protein [Thauera sp.]
MDLLLWRHAEAVDGTPDHTRELTARGLKQARRMARWLDENRPKQLKVLASPTLRTRQTATAFTDDFEIVSSLGPDGNVADILAATGWPDGRGAALVVGHQPALGRLCALLLSGSEADWTIKKGALWWFTNRVRENETQTVLRAVIPSELA